MGKYNYMNLNQKMIKIRRKVPKLIRKRYSEDVTYDFVKTGWYLWMPDTGQYKYGVDFDILSEKTDTDGRTGNSMFLKEMGASGDMRLTWSVLDRKCRPSGRQGTELLVNQWSTGSKGAMGSYMAIQHHAGIWNGHPDIRKTGKASKKPKNQKKGKGRKKRNRTKQEQTEPVREKKTDCKKLMECHIRRSCKSGICSNGYRRKPAWTIDDFWNGRKRTGRIFRWRNQSGRSVQTENP